MREVGIVLFETAGSLAYTEADLPPDLAGLPLTYHVHLPLDLPWQDGPNGAQATWDIVRRLVAITDYLSPNAYVLHPPPAIMGADAATAPGAFCLAVARGRSRYRPDTGGKYRGKRIDGADRRAGGKPGAACAWT